MKQELQMVKVPKVTAEDVELGRLFQMKETYSLHVVE